jgi:precorrin-2 dehydrogenase / sirohydrochlorin ferrochelatase
MKYYPIYLNMKDRSVLIVGGGHIAWQKIPALLESEARVHVVSPDALPEIEAQAGANKLKWTRRTYQTADIEKSYLVIAATDDPELQKQVAAEARARNIWVNVVDVTPLCDFIAPAIVSQGEMQIAISTGGASPALARFIREKLEPQFGPEYGVLTDMLQKHRPEILKLPKQRRQEIWEHVITQEFIDRVKREGPATAESKLKELIHGNTAV